MTTAEERRARVNEGQREPGGIPLGNHRAWQVRSLALTVSWQETDGGYGAGVTGSSRSWRDLLAMFAQEALIVEKTLKTQCTLLTSLALTSLLAWEWWSGSGVPDCRAGLPLAQGPLTLLGLGTGVGGP